jgi:hypothetical protein
MQSCAAPHSRALASGTEIIPSPRITPQTSTATILEELETPCESRDFKCRDYHASGQVFKRDISTVERPVVNEESIVLWA